MCQISIICHSDSATKRQMILQTQWKLRDAGILVGRGENRDYVLRPKSGSNQEMERSTAPTPEKRLGFEGGEVEQYQELKAAHHGEGADGMKYR